MSCRKCFSEALATFPSEVRLYMNRSLTINLPPLTPAPEICVCLDCGHAEFSVAPRWLAAGWLRSFRPVPETEAEETPQTI